MQSRKGKHKEDKSLLGAYVTPEVKALAMLASDVLGISMTELLVNGIHCEAIRAGVWGNGSVTAKYSQSFEVFVSMTREKLIEKNRNRNNNHNKEEIKK